MEIILCSLYLKVNTEIAVIAHLYDEVLRITLHPSITYYLWYSSALGKVFETIITHALLVYRFAQLHTPKSTQQPWLHGC